MPFPAEISNGLEISIQSDELLAKSLVSHVKNMDNWNDITDTELDMQSDYEAFGEFFEVRQMAEEKFHILEKYLPYNLSAKMKESIVIHICAALLRSQKNAQPCSVIVSCPGSIATGKFLEAQIKNYFNFHVVETMTTKQVEAASGYFADVDFIISTVLIPDAILPVVVVSPLITIEDIKKVQHQAFKRKQKAPATVEKFPLLEQLRAIYETGNEEKITYLNQELEKLLTKVFQAETVDHKNSALLSLLKPEHIRFVQGERVWQQAIEEAAIDLLREGYVNQQYVQEAIENVEEYGNYIIVNKGIALAHARKEAGALKDGISLLIAKEGIHFAENEVVYLLFFFAQESEMNYLDMFQEIIRIGDNQENMKRIVESDSKEMAYHFL